MTLEDRLRARGGICDETTREHLKIMEVVKEQLLIVLLRRLGGEIKILTSEIDDTHGAKFAFRLSEDGKTFEFEVIEKENGHA